MFKKDQSFVTKGNQQIQSGNIAAGMGTILEGLRYYQEKILKTVNPYPQCDAALMVKVLRVIADDIEKNNPDGKALLKWLDEKVTGPEVKTTEKFHKTKPRKG